MASVVAALFAACAGPPASDAEVCRDLVRRLCLPERCSIVDSELSVGSDCEATLLARTGCGDDDFQFSEPSRPRFLECRLPLLRRGAHVEQHPACEDVEESFDRCPDVVRFLGGRQ